MPQIWTVTCNTNCSCSTSSILKWASAFTDYDQTKYHTNEILNIIEVDGLQLYYQQDKDMFFREQDRRWLPMNDNSSCRKSEMVGGKMKSSVFHIS